MFPYVGRKKQLAPLYPAPKYPFVLEPFAGSMGYTLHHKPADALGIEKDARVVELWHQLEKLDPWTCDYAMPAPTKGEMTSEFYSQMLEGHWTSEVSVRTSSWTVTSQIARRWKKATRYAAVQAEYAREHVTYIEGDYRDAPDVVATWFIDPPYQKSSLAHGRGYHHSAKDMDFSELAEWVMSRRGQVIVCEGAEADWLPFENLTVMANAEGNLTVEKVFVRETQPTEA